MIFGKIKNYEGTDDTVRVRVIEKSYEKKIFNQLIKENNEYRVFLNYGYEYKLIVEKKGFQTLRFDISLKIPESVPACCFTPMEFSMTMIKPDKITDSLFKENVIEIAYENSLKNFNYDFDIDFIIQRKIVQADIDNKKKYLDKERYEAYRDSIEKEEMYLTLINRGNIYFYKEQFFNAQEMFTRAKELKPEKNYPRYKLEDINTEIEIFRKKSDSTHANIDSIIIAEKMLLEENRPKPIPKFVYKPMTPEQVQAVLVNEIKDLIKKETNDTSEINERISDFTEAINTPLPVDTTTYTEADFVFPEDEDLIPLEIEELDVPDSIYKDNPVVSEVKDSVAEIIVKEDPIKPEITDLDSITDKEEVFVSEIKPQKEIFNEKVYQDSLKVKYPDKKTVEVTEDMYKKTTRTIMNIDGKIGIYIKVEHFWGATYYFIDRTPLPMENISSAFYETSIRLPDKETDSD